MYTKRLMSQAHKFFFVAESGMFLRKKISVASAIALLVSTVLLPGAAGSVRAADAISVARDEGTNDLLGQVKDKQGGHRPEGQADRET